MRAVVLMLLSLWFGAAQSAVEVHSFAEPEQERTYKRLIAELRCLVCQNQNIADSNADLAKDLRQEIFEMINQGKSYSDIVDFMVARYGDFVLYNPPMKAKTGLLWFGPFIILAMGLFLLFRTIVRRKRVETVAPSDAERQRIKQLLEGKERE